jgi:phytoene dehydrogenase-like protein
MMRALLQSHGFGQLSIMRPGSDVPQNPNVLMVGASSRPGNGVPLVLIGAKLVSQKALQRLQELSRKK